MNLKLKRTPGLYLVGFMASGKSTVGRHLAHRIGWSFYDLDSEIEAAERMTIADIFEHRGEPEFRRLEHDMLRQHVRWIERGRPAVLALGGGAFVQEPNRELIQEHGVSIWLDCPFDVVRRRVAAHHVVRPLARDPQQFEALWNERRRFYELADVRVPVDCDEPDRMVEAILATSVLK